MLENFYNKIWDNYVAPFLIKLEAIETNHIALTFIFFIVIVFVIFAGLLLFKKTRSFSRQAPGILTSLGILGTFSGIFIGLLGFDFTDIEESIPDLLEGLKIAFATSIFGLFLALVFKIISGLFFARSNSKAESEERNLFEVIEELMDTIAGKENDEGGTLEAIKKLTKSIVGDNKEESLLGQIKSLQIDINKGFKEQKEAFNEFAEQVAQSGAEALIAALEKVIKNFNEKISEQFGDNFKQLNDGVGKLLEWQGKMKEAMELAVTSIERSKNSLEQSKNIMGEVQRSLIETQAVIKRVQESLEKIETSTATIPEHAQNMSEMLTMLGNQTLALSEALGAFAQLREKAVDAIPLVAKNLEDISSGIQNSIQKMQENWKETMDTVHSSQKNQVEEMGTAFSNILGGVEKNLTDISSGIQTSIQQVEESWKKAVDTMQTSQQSQLGKMEKELSNMLTTISASIKTAIQEVGESWEESMKAMHTSQKNQVGVMETEFATMLGGVHAGFNKTQEEMNTAIGNTIQAYTGNLSGMAERIAADYGEFTSTVQRLTETLATFRSKEK